MKKSAYVLLCPVIFALSTAAADKFPASCPSGQTAHFPTKKAALIDRKCGPKGNPSKDQPGDGPQNQAKTNFCTDSSTAETIMLAKIASLQGDAEAQENALHFKPGEPPLDRAFLKTLGEGNLVVFEGFVFGATQECKETVNCEAAVPNKNASHDIHIAMREDPRTTHDTDPKPDRDKEECAGFVAEMIPHHRPAEWTACNVKDVAKKGLRVRVMGQQFFDGSHVTCKDGAPVGSNPKRISLWEIHPIYSFEVCPSGDCATGGWQPLEQFAAGKTTCAEETCN